jgi:hypothetical protein
VTTRAAVLTALAVTCCGPSAPAPPEQTILSTPLAPGRAEAFFRFDTGGDQMSEGRRQPRLDVFVRFADRELRRPIASCDQPSRGTALGGGTERELDVALCGAEYWLISEPGVVRVVRVEDAIEKEDVARFELGDTKLRATSPAE